MKKAVLTSVLAAAALVLFLSIGAQAETMGGSSMHGGKMLTNPSGSAQQPYGWTGYGMGPGMMGGMGSGMMGGMGRGMMGGMGRGMMGGMGSGMMGGMGPGMMGYGGHGRLQYLQQALDLSDEQVNKIRSFFTESRKEAIKKGAEIRIANIELRELIRSPKTDMNAVKAKLDEIARLRTALSMARIEKHEKVKSVLTPEQLEKFYKSSPSFMGTGGGKESSD